MPTEPERSGRIPTLQITLKTLCFRQWRDNLRVVRGGPGAPRTGSFRTRCSPATARARSARATCQTFQTQVITHLPAPGTRNPHVAGFTLAEVLAALLFLAIVVPVAIAALQVAGLSGEVAERKAMAARIADRVLSETVVTASSLALPQKGTAVEKGEPFRWTVQRENWPVILTSTSAMQMLTVEVAFLAHGHNYDVQLSTLVNGP